MKACVCETCGKGFKSHPSKANRFCSRPCYWKSLAGNSNARVDYSGPEEKYCEQCGNQFRRNPKDTYEYWEKKRFCGYACYWENLKAQEPWNKGELVTLACDYCEQAFLVRPAREEEARYCSHKCFSDHRKETGALRGANHPHWGKKRPEISGENNWNWNGGSSRAYKTGYGSTRHRHWRTAVFERDNYICQGCGKRGGYLEAHHVKPWRDYPGLRFDVGNGKTLCIDCHAEIDEYRARFILRGD